MKRAGKQRVEMASFRLARAMIRRDSQLATRTWPSLSPAVAALAVGIATDQLGNPFAGSSQVTLTMAFPILVATAVPLLYQQMMFSRDHEASWIFVGVPRAAVVRGVRRALLRWYVLPPAVLGGAAMAWHWQAPWHAALLTILLWLMAHGAGRLAEIYVLGRAPFSSPPRRGAATGRASAVSAAATAGAAGLAALSYAVGSPWGVSCLLAVLALVLLGLDRRSRTYG